MVYEDLHFVHTATKQKLQTHLDAILKTSVAQAAGSNKSEKNCYVQVDISVYMKSTYSVQFGND